jgi:Glycosyltransferase family 87
VKICRAVQAAARTGWPPGAWSASGRVRAALAGAGLLSLLGYALGVPTIAGRGPRTLEAYVVLSLALFALYLLAVVVVLRWPAWDRRTLSIILGFAVLFRLAVLPSPIMLSSDLYRYLWDGRVQGSGINPYRYPPAADALQALRDPAIYPNINRPSQPTVYPPGAEIVFALVTAVAPDSIVGWRLFVLGCEALTAVLLLGLLRRMAMPPSSLLVYAWSPLAVFEGVQAGHIDFVMLPALLLALRWRQAGRMVGAGLALGLAVLVKLYPALLLVAWHRRGDRRLPAAFTGVLAAGYLTYLVGVGPGVLGFLPRYFGTAEDFNIGLRAFVTEPVARAIGEDGHAALGRTAIELLRRWGFVDPQIPLGRLLSPEDEHALQRTLRAPATDLGSAMERQLGREVVRALAMFALFGALALVLIRIGRRRQPGPRGVFEATMAAIGAYLILVPTAMHAWYAAWILPFLTARPSAAWFWLTGTVSLSYLKYAWEPAGLPLWVPVLEFVPLYGLLLWEWRARRVGIARLAEAGPKWPRQADKEAMGR